MAKQLFEVEIVRDGDLFIARITMPDGEVITIESETLEGVLDNLGTELQEKYEAVEPL